MTEGGLWTPVVPTRWIAVWRRNFLVWRKLMIPSLIGHFGEPVLYLTLFGYGLGALVGEVDGMPYMVFIASGLACSTAMFAASFEALYSAFTRMKEQETWSAMLNTPLGVADVAAGEIVWAATKGLVNAAALMIVAGLLGLVQGPMAVMALPIILLAGLAFGGMAMVVTAVAPSYDFFLYYFTLVLTPMLLLGGVFFPLENLPGFVRDITWVLPITHTVALVRPLMTDTETSNVLLHLGVITLWAVATWAVAIRLLARRLLR